MYELHNPDFEENVRKRCACKLLVFGLLDLSAIERRAYDCSSKLTLKSSVFSGFTLRLFHHDIVRGGRFTRDAFFAKLKRLWNLLRPVSVPRHLGNAIGRPMSGLGFPSLGHRIEELRATGLLMIWHIQDNYKAHLHSDDGENVFNSSRRPHIPHELCRSRFRQRESRNPNFSNTTRTNIGHVASANELKMSAPTAAMSPTLSPTLSTMHSRAPSIPSIIHLHRQRSVATEAMVPD